MRTRVLFLLSALLLTIQHVAAAQVTASRPPLAPGDVVRIAVWREPDLSGEFIVNDQGIVTLPLLGRMDVSSTPASELSDKLISAYAVQLKNPSVTVTALRRIYVLGDVMKPGLYPADPTMILAGVVALAGGATPTGDLSKIRVVRGGTTINTHLDANSILEMTDIRSGDQIFVDRRSWVDRNSAIVASALISTVTLVISLLLR
jgi:protein involved in polysaccharide export with SLBB domain